MIYDLCNSLPGMVTRLLLVFNIGCLNWPAMFTEEVPNPCVVLGPSIGFFNPFLGLARFVSRLICDAVFKWAF